MVSRLMASRPLAVILTVRRAVFICGETEAMVPLMMVPFFNSIVTVSLAHFVRNLQFYSRQPVSVDATSLTSFIFATLIQTAN